MKTRKWTLLVVLVTGVAVSTIMLRTRSPHLVAAEATESTQPLDQDEAVVFPSSPAVAIDIRGPALTVPLAPDSADGSASVGIASEAADVVRIRADRVLARVNDQAVLLKDLVPIGADEQEQAMTAEEYQSRLDRAIDMELTFQAAAAQGVELTPEQRTRVEGVGQRYEATLREYEKQGVTWSSVTLAQLEFEQRLTSALLLQQNLVAREVRITPGPNLEVQARYEQTWSEVLSRLKAEGNIAVSIAEL